MCPRLRSTARTLTLEQNSRELQATLYWRVQVNRIFSVTGTFSDQVKGVIDGKLVHKVTRMRLSTGEHHARGASGIFLF